MRRASQTASGAAKEQKTGLAARADFDIVHRLAHFPDVGGDEGFFGERVAARYDARSASVYDPAVVGPTVDLLAELAGDGAALEFGIGTGRIALPLAERGVTVAGIDSSEAMLERLREKPGAAGIEAVAGDFATTRVEGEFSLVFLIFNTIFNLTSQDAQVACFENAAAHLRGGGRFVIETGVPPLRNLPPGQTVLPIRADREGFSFSTFDVVTQRYSNHHFYVDRRPGRVVSGRVPLRLAGRTGPHGPPRRHAAGAPLGRLGAGAVHGHEPVARVGVAEAVKG